MADQTPFDFDISAAADKKRRSRARAKSTGAVETSSRKCHREGCGQAGLYRAPKSPDRPTEYIWFCRKHVSEYNLRWNFFKANAEGGPASGEGESEGGKERKLSSSERIAWARLGIDDPLEILGANGTRPRVKESVRSGRFTPTERRALQILDLAGDVDIATVRRTFSTLVKDLHPDLNGGDRTDEARLQEVVWAWSQLKDCRALKD